MGRLIGTQAPDVLIGEPVGSCTDLSATVLQPLKRLHSDQYELAPFSVVVDGRRLRDSLQHADRPRFPENVMYIYRKQLEEADLIVLNKADLLRGDDLAEVERFLRQEYTGTPVLTVSALEGTGIDSWLDYVMTNSIAGRTIAEVDYDEYADGEAALGWLNAAVRLEALADADWTGCCKRFVETMQRELQELSAEIAHLKLHLRAGSGSLAVNVTSNDEEASIRGAVDGSSKAALLLINVRARIDPTQLRGLAEQCVQDIAGDSIRAKIEEIQSFAPARPEPVHRFASVV
jgi:G3E family GTPase